MLQIIRSYLLFLIKAQTEHGVHSPFVYNLLINCFYNTKPYTAYNQIIAYRKEVLKNKTVIQVTDFGAGSRVFSSTKRPVYKIAKTAGIPLHRAKLLFRLIHYFQPQEILEIGTSVGLATSALALGNKKANITSLEGCPETQKIAKTLFLKQKYTNTTFVTTEFSSFLKEKTTKHYHFIYFDGNHSKKATIAYFTMLLDTVTSSTVWVFDDIHWSKEMEDAWNYIKQHKKVTVTIDTFFWGIVFFRKEQNKEHFTLYPSKTIASKLAEKIRIKM